MPLKVGHTRSVQLSNAFVIISQDFGNKDNYKQYMKFMVANEYAVHVLVSLNPKYPARCGMSTNMQTGGVTTSVPVSIACKQKVS